MDILKQMDSFSLKGLIILISMSLSMAILTTYTPHILSMIKHFILKAEQRWSRSAKSLLSLSLSPAEQTAFEEQFKYLIVTSPLLNEMPLQPTMLPDMTPKKGSKRQDMLLFWVLAVSIVHLVLGLCAMTFARTPYQKDMSLLFLSCTYLSACYFIYRHERHLQIRMIHNSALDAMHQVISLSQKSDSMMTQLNQLEPFRSHLVSHFETYIKFVQQLEPLTDARNLTRFRDMYNTKEIPVHLLQNLSQEEDVDLIYSIVCWKRREYLLHLLALDGMHEGVLARAIKINTGLVQEYHTLNKTLYKLCSSSSDIPTSPITSKDVTSDTRSSASLINRLLAVEKHMEDIQISLFLCKQDTKSFTSGRGTIHSLDRMKRRFDVLDNTIPNLLNQWQESKIALEAMMQQDNGLPSPPASPRDVRFHHNEDDNRIRHSIHRLSMIQT